MDFLLYYDGSAHEDEMWNAHMKLDQSLTEGITVMCKVSVELLLLDSTNLPLDNDHLRLTSKICATLGLILKNDPLKGHGTDHHGATSVGTNYIIAS